MELARGITCFVFFLLSLYGFIEGIRELRYEIRGSNEIDLKIAYVGAIILCAVLSGVLGWFSILWIKILQYGY